VKPYLNKEKIIAWYLKNDPSSLLMMKLKNGEWINSTSRYDSSWMDEFDGKEVSIDQKNNLILNIIDEEETSLGEGYERKVNITIEQPEKEAWIIWR
jgi:hypothetical protein